MVRQTAIVLVLTLGAGSVRLAAEEVPASSPTTLSSPEDIDVSAINLGFPEAPEEEVLPLLAALGDPDFATREAATKALEAFGPGSFRAMSRAYRESDDYEVRARIESLIRTQFLWHTLFKRRGFLGVGFPQNVFNVLPDGTVYVELTHVQRGSAAEECGLRQGDCIVALDGVGFAEGLGVDAFKERIENKGAGGVLRLSVQRDGALLERTATLRARPLQHYNQPALVETLNAALHDFATWQARYFTLPERHRERMPSSAVLQIPD